MSLDPIFSMQQRFSEMKKETKTVSVSRKKVVYSLLISVPIKGMDLLEIHAPSQCLHLQIQRSIPILPMDIKGTTYIDLLLDHRTDKNSFLTQIEELLN